MKQKRHKDRNFLDFVKTLPCVACGSKPCDPDHIATRGAGGDDSARNVWPLCRKHHAERGNKGLVHMFETYPQCLAWLLNFGRFDIIERQQIWGTHGKTFY